MPFTNEQIAELVKRKDQRAEWVYNQYCGFCARFIYPGDSKCKKCGTQPIVAVKRPLPFDTSATALYKLIGWYGPSATEVRRAFIMSEFGKWLQAALSDEDYATTVIECIGTDLIAQLGG